MSEINAGKTKGSRYKGSQYASNKKTMPQKGGNKYPLLDFIKKAKELEGFYLMLWRLTRSTVSIALKSGTKPHRPIQ